MPVPHTGTAEVAVASLLRPEGATGVQSHVQGLRTAARELGRELELVTPFDARSPLLAPVFGVRHLLHPVSAPASVWWYRRWHRHYLEVALRDRLRQPAARRTIYAQCPVSAEAALRVRTTQAVAMVVHFNVSQADEWAEKGELQPGDRVFRGIRRQEERVLPALDGLVYVSEFMRDVVQERIPATRDVPSLVAPNFVEVGPVRHPVDHHRDLVSVGSLEPRKNHAFLLEVLAIAARRGQRYTLTIVGDGPDRLDLERRAQELGVKDLVEFAGFTPDPRAVLRRHRLYCHASRMESFGIALIEAMAEGLPVVAAPVGGVPEIVRPGVDGELWSLEDAEGACDVLVGLLSDADRLAALGEAAWAGARARFSGDEVGPRLLAFLDELRSRTMPG